MRQVIRKYKLQDRDGCIETFELRALRVLRVGIEKEDIYIYVLEHPDTPRMEYQFFTGFCDFDLNDLAWWDYLGGEFLDSKSFHVFWRKKETS